MESATPVTFGATKAQCAPLDVGTGGRSAPNDGAATMANSERAKNWVNGEGMRGAAIRYQQAILCSGRFHQTVAQWDR